MMSGMAWDIIGMIAVGIGMAAVVYAASHALRKAGIWLPRWIMPAQFTSASRRGQVATMAATSAVDSA